ncbi:HTH-type transcriptional regulator CzcR [Paenibacillus nuruki]|nr:HTH-type transcriptional regulator CzcR [Paenibacillus nuruki]
MLNMHALYLFHTIAIQGSVTKAANLLNISQPAITTQIKKLEKDIGITLFIPQGRGIALTIEAKELLGFTQRIFAITGQVEQWIQQYHQGQRGQIRLAATYLPAHFLLPTWIAKFKQQYEHVDMTITTTNSTDALRQLLQMEVDIAIYGGLAEEQTADIQAEELFRDELWFVVAPNHRYAGQHISLQEMMKEPFVMREQGSSTRERLLALCRTHNTPPPQIPLQFNGLPEAIQAVIAGYGANFVSSFVVRDYVERGQLARVFVNDVYLQNSIAICTRLHEPLSTASQQFVHTIRQDSSMVK